MAGLQAGGAGLATLYSSAASSSGHDGHDDDLMQLMERCRVPLEICSPFAALSGKQAPLYLYLRSFRLRFM